MKKVMVCWLLFLCLFLCSCGNAVEEYAVLKAEFSKYNPNNDVALVVRDWVVYFNDHEVDLEKLISESEGADNVDIENVAVRNDWIYFVTDKKIDRVGSFSLYRCDKNGDHLTVLFEKNEVELDVDVAVWDELIYIEYRVGDQTFVDYYNCTTEEYGSFGRGENIKYEDFLNESRPYSAKISDKKKCFIVTDNATQKEYVIDDSFLSRTEYHDSLNKFKYTPFTYSLADDKVVLLYRIEKYTIDFSALFNTNFVIFEYDLDSQELVFLTTLSTFDCEIVRFRYNVKDVATG